ncbi:GntR family transcriptional regulator [Microbacterium azadirachtae]|uniref:Transcriptional regulator, GntR family n=1 Tax=Microbacterium azadirachtae TaxID=582680 RepID=A0A1I6G9S8_9MICO|nr:GntR family transcriptional regulator [Microbacterium azadirachtae]SDL38438.1 transcriptional regulator, GntR family [Microbacterium azadirachtae]SEF69408.1 transcriptional regulator, GntR family [Microbacterium azadirachtae]SEF70132.1 transcriptional regulator, GntR family [Microbacterium azadirachtae]SFR38891.1 transcriptional regulator, GntR family [Microbacterium azadirachtae]
MNLPAAARHAYEQLIGELETGLFPPGTRLPGERELSARFHVSRATLRVALSALETEGRLQRSAQRGWFVPAQVIGEPPSTLQSFTEMARARGLQPTAQVLAQNVRPATLDESERLRVAPTAPVIQIDRLRSMDGMPVCFDVVVVPMQRAEVLATADLTDASLYEALQQLCGLTVHRSAYTVMASVADPALAKMLGTSVGSPILIGEETAYASDGTPILVGVNRYRGDAYRFEADLYRRT